MSFDDPGFVDPLSFEAFHDIFSLACQYYTDHIHPIYTSFMEVMGSVLKIVMLFYMFLIIFIGSGVEMVFNYIKDTITHYIGENNKPTINKSIIQ
jgi:hypothetical protein